MARAALAVLFFVFGSLIGSFLNVCIHRLPRNESVVKPPSHCPSCHNTIPWYDNVPLVSYILLRARCRFCGEPIRGRYFIVELLAASLALGLFLRFGLHAVTFVYAGLAFALLVVSFIDFEHRIIPDVISLPGIVLGLALSAIMPELHPRLWPWEVVAGPPLDRVLDSVSGLVLGGGTLQVMGFLWHVFFRKEAMGGGDVKLAALLGSFLGWQFVLLAIFISALVGSIVGLTVMVKTREHYIPYGPYLALGALVAIFAGENLISLYLSLGTRTMGVA